MGLDNAITDQEKRVIVTMTETGLSATKIAALIGRAVSAVTKVQNLSPDLKSKRQFGSRCELTVQNVPEVTMKELTAAAARRPGMTVEQAALKILMHVIHRGAIDKALCSFPEKRWSESYLNDDASEAALTGSEV